MSAFDGSSRWLRPVAVGAAALGLTVGVLGAGLDVAGAGATALTGHHASRFEPVTNYQGYVGGYGKANP